VRGEPSPPCGVSLIGGRDHGYHRRTPVVVEGGKPVRFHCFERPRPNPRWVRRVVAGPPGRDECPGGQAGTTRGLRDRICILTSGPSVKSHPDPPDLRHLRPRRLGELTADLLRCVPSSHHRHDPPPARQSGQRAHVTGGPSPSGQARLTERQGSTVSQTFSQGLREPSGRRVEGDRERRCCCVQDGRARLRFRVLHLDGEGGRAARLARLPGDGAALGAESQSLRQRR